MTTPSPVLYASYTAVRPGRIAAWVRLALGTVLLAACLGRASTAHAQASLTLVDDETIVRRVSFRFVETQTFEDQQLEQQIATHGPSFWTRLRQRLPLFDADYPPFDPVALQKDVVRLRLYYQRHGFLHPTIRYDTSQLDTTHNAIHVIFVIDEGPPLLIRDVDFLGPGGDLAYEQFDETLRSRWIDFRDDITLQVGERYSTFDGVRIQDEVLTWLKNAGFAFATVETVADVDTLRNAVDLDIHVETGPQGVFSEVIIEGNEKLSRSVVLRELPFKVGERFSSKKLIEGQRELFALDLFRVVIADIPEQEADESVTVRYRVREARERRVSALTGYARETGLTGQAEWRHRNFLGGARQFIVSTGLRTGIGGAQTRGIEPARRFTSSLSLRQPYLFSTNLVGIVSPFHTWENIPLQQLAFQEVGLNTTLLYEIYRFRTVSLQHTFTRVFGDVVGDPLAEVPITDRLVYDRSILSLSSVLGVVDNFFEPTSGFLLRPGAEVAGQALGSAVQYYKTSFEAIGYLPLTERYNLSGRLFVGRVWPLGQSRRQGDPTVEAQFDRIRFYAGGGSDVRGYPDNLIGPVLVDSLVLDPGTDEETIVLRLEPLGGLAKLAGNVELRMPFPGLGSKWQTAVFVDAGQVYDYELNLQREIVGRNLDLDLSELRVGTGAGIRFRTLVGYVRLDVGFKVNPSIEDLASPEDLARYRQGRITRDAIDTNFWDRFRIHLSIGQPF